MEQMKNLGPYFPGIDTRNRSETAPPMSNESDFGNNATNRKRAEKASLCLHTIIYTVHPRNDCELVFS